MKRRDFLLTSAAAIFGATSLSLVVAPALVATGAQAAKPGRSGRLAPVTRMEHIDCAECGDHQHVRKGIGRSWARVKPLCADGKSRLWHWGNGKLFSDPKNFGPICGEREPGNNGVATEKRLVTCSQCRVILRDQESAIESSAKH